ncbi:uncharacterized protein LOC110441185 isoform X2 [Mizuhopecten yessoensis]|uniref:uncharacterized protein LOC110441185 isoform X2 n=1 Tax=Mizuhopecten yessoensis TaxID=6573 RepID=UPI000B45D1BA|nr:uncharacterized protein LOC110441185 isoform X2 [Mizuhopecten yessoensis]
MASNYQSSSVTTNFARLSRLVLDVVCDLLRDVLEAKVPPPGLTAILGSQKDQLCRNLEHRQRQILYPSGRVFSGTLEDLDFTLLYKLLRNLQSINIPPHQTGWGKPPDPADRSLSANIDRLRVQRNESYGHLSTASLSDSDFNNRWYLIRQSVCEIEKDALTGDTYVTAVDDLLTVSMDPEAETYYIEELEKQHKADLEVKAIVHEVKARQEVMATNISDVSTRQEVMATNISDVLNRQEVMATTISDVATRQEVMATNISDVFTRQEVMATNISDVSTRQEVMASNTSDVSTRQEVMATNISDVSTRQEVMATNISDVSNRQEVMSTTISDVSTRQEVIARDMHDLKGNLAAMNVTTANTKIHPDLEPMIETTKAKIKKEKEEKKFYPTKGFCDAKEKLLKNKVVVIKGNTGDGKTAIAVQLLHWLSQEQEAGQPLQLHMIEKLDLLAPNLKLITFIDDVFGEKDVCKKDVQEWNKRVSDVNTLFVDERTQTNFLIITIRNEIFNSLEERSLGTILTIDNIIDLSSHTYQVAEEKSFFLELYKPEKFSWTDKEKARISTYAPNIGFPQCCQLFYNSEELQKERDRFFENPFHFLNEALSKLQECSALLYLFLNGGMIKVKDLDPNNTKIKEKWLKQAFSVKLIGGKCDKASLFHDNMGKVGYIKDSFNELLGFLVKKEKHWSGEDVYRFNHDSIYVAVALLYGQVTLIGFIQNCPSKSLSYLTTSKTASNMIVIASDHYTEMCERLLREFECKKYLYGTSIGSLDVWNDPVFVKRFVRFLNDRKVDKLDVLNKACYFGAGECVLYLLSKGVKPDKYTAWWSLISIHRNDSSRQVCLLRKIVVYLNDKTKVDVLNKACYSGAEECVLYLLSGGVKPNKDTALSLVTSEHWNDRNRQVCLLRKIVVHLNDKTKLAVLNKACHFGAGECVLYLLSEGVKPDKDTAWWSLIDRHRNDRNRLVFLLRKIVLCLNDKTKLDVLNKACSSGAEECVLYLLSEGVKPDKDTALSLVTSEHWNDSNRLVCLLRKIVVYLNDETKLDVLNKACSSGAEECVLYLLLEGVKPDKDTVLSLVSSEHWNDSNRQVCLLRKIVLYLNDETQFDVLNKACSSGAEECVLYLLSEGVKPDKDTALSLVSGCWNDSNRQVCLLRKIVVYLNDKTKLAVLNEACYSGAEECALHLLCAGVEPDKETVFSVVEGGSVKVLRKLLQYDVTPTARYYYNFNVLHTACESEKEEMVTLLCDTYPHLVHDTGWLGRTPLRVVARRGNCFMFQTVERCVLNSLYRVEDQQHKCELVDGRVVHRNCACAQYMAQLLGNDGGTVLHESFVRGNRELCLYLCRSYPALTTAVSNAGRTVLHYSCMMGNREVCLYLFQSYPALTTAVDNDGYHCLHYLALLTSDVDWFTECETHVKQHLESTGRKYDSTTILDNKGDSVLDKAKERAKFWGTKNDPLLDHLIKAARRFTQKHTKTPKSTPKHLTSPIAFS